MGKSFRFKKFTIDHDQSSMKVNTDAVLLGAWVDAASAKSVLEIGTGCGVIALMLAQRSGAQIEGIDIDSSSVLQAKSNVLKSGWSDRIKITQTSLQEFQKHSNKKFDLIVSNPPFFIKSLKSAKENRNISRHDEKLSFDELISGVIHFLDSNGRFSLILPLPENIIFREKALINGLHPLRELYIYPKRGKPVKRICTEFSFVRSHPVEKSELAVRNNDDTFTSEYRELTGEFYL